MIDLVARLRLDDQLSSTLKKTTAVAAIGFAAITAGAVASVNKFVDFDNAIRKTGAIAGASATELDALKNAAIDMGASTSKNATEVAESMSEMAAAGFNANQVISAMPGIISASEASGESLAVAADTVSSALNIWSLEASNSGHVADVLAMAANVSAAGITDLGYAFKYAGAPAAALGVSLEETAAAIGIMTNSGIDGSSAGTALRASLLALNNPAKAQAKIMDKLGFSVTDAQGNFKTLSGMIGDMQKATEGMTEADKVATLGKLVGTEAVSGFLALMKEGPDAIDAMTNSLVNSDGAAKETADQMMGGIGGALEELGGTIDSFMIKVGEAFSEPISDVSRFLASIDTDAVVENIGNLINKAVEIGKVFVDNWPAIKEAVIGVATAVLAFKGIMFGLGIIGTVTTLINAYRAGTLLATLAQMGFNTTLWANPITWVVAGIAVLIGIIVVLVRNWDTVSAATKRFWESIGGLSGVIGVVLGPIGFLINAAIDLAKNWDSTKSVWENVWGAIQRSAATSINAVIGLINAMIETINKIPGVNIPIVAKVDWGSASKAPSTGLLKADNSKKQPTNMAASKSSSKLLGGTGHYNGLDYVPYNGYAATLHKGERVMTAQENKEASSGGSGNKGGVTVTGNTFNVRQESDIDAIAYRLAKLIEGEAM